MASQTAGNAAYDLAGQQIENGMSTGMGQAGNSLATNYKREVFSFESLKARPIRKISSEYIDGLIPKPYSKKLNAVEVSNIIQNRLARGNDPFLGVDINISTSSKVGWTFPFLGINVGELDIYWIMHEFGHVLQYRQDNIMWYTLYYATPSLLNQGKLIGPEDHYDYYTEKDANLRSFNYFKNYFDNNVMNQFYERYMKSVNK